MHGQGAPASLTDVEGVDPMPDPVRYAQEQVAAIYWAYKPDSNQWGLLMDVLRRLMPSPRAAGVEVRRPKS